MPGGHAQWLPRTGSRGGERRRSPGPPGAVGGPATHGCEIGLCARGWLRANGLPRARSPGFRVTPGTSQRVCGRRGSEGRPNQWRRSSGSTAEGSRRCRRRRDLPLCMEFLGDLTPRNQVSANVAARTNHAPVRLHWPNRQGSQYWRANLAARGPIGALR